MNAENFDKKFDDDQEDIVDDLDLSSIRRANQKPLTITGTVKLHRVLRAPAERVYRAFLDAGAMAKWLPPHGFTGRVLSMDAQVGGSYRMSFTNFSTGHSHSFGGTYVELVPGERIVGILMPGEGITIYPIFAKALEQFDNQPERWVDLAWDTGAEEQRFPARLTVTILNEVGSLAQMTQAISDLGGNIDALMMVAREGARDFYDVDITLEVHDLKHLNEIMTSLRGKPSVSDVSRKTG